MNYSALIQNRKSVREFTDKQVPAGDLDQIRKYYSTSVSRLIPEIKTELLIFSSESREALEGAAGYNRFLVGAPHYMVLLSEAHKQIHLNAGYVMEDMILKLADMDLDSCWLTFTDSEAVKKVLGISSELEVAAIAAFGFGKKTTKRLRLNILSMSNVDVVAKHRYMEPKRSVQDLAFVERWGNSHNLDRYIGFFDDMLWEALYAASLAPSYLNRQAYGFVLDHGCVYLIRRPDKYTTKEDGELSLGVVLHHFSSVAENWTGRLIWEFDPDPRGLGLPEGHEAVAVCSL